MNRREFLGLAGTALAATAAKGAPPATADAGADAPFFRARPHVQLLGDDRFGVVWMTSVPATGWIEWSQDGGATWTKAWTETDGLRDAGSTVHRAIVDAGYDPRKPLVCRVHSRPIAELAGYHVKYAGEEESLKLELDGIVRPDGSVSFLMLNDTHEMLDDYPALMRPVKEPVSFTCFNGDILDSVRSEQLVVEKLLSPMADVCAHTRAPCWYLRGNHETRGPLSRQLRNYLALQDGHFYGAATLGSSRIAFIDSGEDKADDHAAYSGLVDFDHYLDVQHRFFEREFASDAWRNAGVRIVFSHIPPWFPFANNEKKWWRNLRAPRLDRFFDFLNGANVTLMVVAHIHTCTYGDPYSTRRRFPELRNYPIVAGGGPLLNDKEPACRPTLGRFTVKGKSVDVRFVNAEGETVLDRRYTAS